MRHAEPLTAALVAQLRGLPLDTGPLPSRPSAHASGWSRVSPDAAPLGESLQADQEDRVPTPAEQCPITASAMEHAKSKARCYEDYKDHGRTILEVRAVLSLRDLAAYALTSTSANICIYVQDFLKSSTAGFQSSLGEWTLGEVLCAPLFGDRILKGAMSPDRLKLKHNLSDSEIGNLYRILHVFSKGFQDLVQRATCRAQNQSELIKVVWVTYAQLWDAEAHVPFASCVASLFQERDAASGDVTAFQKKSMELGDLNAALQSRASAIVQGSLDRIAVEGQLAAENRSLQGEVATLVASNDILGARASRLRKDKQALRLRVDSLESMLASADDRVRRAATCCANLAMWPISAQFSVPVLLCR